MAKKCSNKSSNNNSKRPSNNKTKQYTKKNSKSKEQISLKIRTFIIKQLSRMSSKMDLLYENEESQFRIEENLKKKKTGGQNKNHRYSVITYEKRVQLINLASSKGYSISRAARELGIKPSTGKFIVKCFRDNGKIMKKTTCQHSKSGSGDSEEGVSETGTPKGDKLQKCYISNDQQQNNSLDKDSRKEVPSPVTTELEAPMFFLSYQYEQPMLNPIIFYPGFENYSGMAIPIMYPQTFQY